MNNPSLYGIMESGRKMNVDYKSSLPTTESSDAVATGIGAAGLAAAAGGLGYGLYRLFGGGKSKGKKGRRSALATKK